MDFIKQDHEGIVTLSEAKGLSLGQRCFTEFTLSEGLSMTNPVLAVNLRYRGTVADQNTGRFLSALLTA